MTPSQLRNFRSRPRHPGGPAFAAPKWAVPGRDSRYIKGMQNNDEIRAAVRGRLDAIGLSVYAAAEAVKLPHRTAGDWLAGRRDITLESLTKLLRAVGLDMTLKPVKGYVMPEMRPRGRKRKSGNSVPT